MTKSNIPEDQVEIIYEHLPALIIDRVEPKQLSEQLNIPAEHIQEVYLSFLAHIRQGVTDATLPSVVSALSDYVKTRFLIQTFKNTKRMGMLWEGVLKSTEDMSYLLDKKVKQARDLMDSDESGDAVSLTDIDKLIKLVEKKVKLVNEVMKESPLVREVTHGPSVTINNNPPTNQPLPEATAEAPEYTGYTAPPKMEDAQVVSVSDDSKNDREDVTV